MPPSGKAQDALLRQKEARQKKILFALAPVLLLLLAWQGPGILKQLSGGNAPTPVPAAASTTEPGSDPTTGAAPTTAGGAVPTVVVATSGLPDTDGLDTAGPGQLITFDRFLGKDPFQQQVVEKEPVVAPPPTKPPSSGGKGPTLTPEEPGTTAPTMALLDTNGTAETVSVKGTFPESDPIFRLVSVTKASVKIGLVTGSFSGGQKTVTIKRGKSVTLASQPDGVRYVITFISTP